RTCVFAQNIKSFAQNIHIPVAQLMSHHIVQLMFAQLLCIIRADTQVRPYDIILIHKNELFY
ncbi:MAG: hypothetical protein LBD11_05715, partial [Candidatus Peribacteria bacterium]|nr:hypothetical protein [Candidatus Peribacteria bacterium]